jgi:short-subunit dehydrogenase
MNQEGMALVTGATTGIGRAISEQLAGMGYDLVVCARSEGDLEEMERHWAGHFSGKKIHTFSVDVSVKEEVARFAGSVRSLTPRLDVLVNNAGVFLPGTVLDEPDGQLERMIETNLYSAYWLTRELAPMMVERGRGYIFNISSIAAITAYASGGSYGMSKQALLGFSRSLRSELKDKGVKVSAILPGATWSASWEGADFPEDRLMQPEDVAQAVTAALRMGPNAVLEEIIIRPQLGDL